MLGALLLPTGAMPGASKQSRRVKIVNANWVAGSDGDDGRFEIQIVTEDDQAHVATPSATAMTALIAFSQAGAVLVWDPADRTLIAANLVGTIPWTVSGTDRYALLTARSVTVTTLRSRAGI